jgi:tetratricopeptide (TPR) repeat protein
MAEAGSQKRIVMLGADITDFWNTHGKNLTLIITILLVVLLVIGGYGYNRQRKSVQAARLLESAKNVQDFQEIVVHYAGTPAAAVALLALGQSFYNEGMYDRALQQYDMFLGKYQGHPLFKAAELGKSLCYEGMGDINQALNGFSSFVMMNQKHFLVPQAELGKARCLQLLGRFDEARTVYEDFIVSHTNSQWADQAKIALTLMEKEMRAKRRGGSEQTNSLNIQSTFPLPASSELQADKSEDKSNQ